MRTSITGLLAASLAVSGVASAHIVAIGWKSVGPGTLEFHALHWHGSQDQVGGNLGALIFDGVSYPFTSALQNTPTLSGFSGGLVNSGYATWNPATGTIDTIGAGANDGTLVDDWLIVTISGISRGDHTLTADAGPGQLTQWTLDGGITDVGIVVGPDLDGPLSSSLVSSTLGLTRSLTRDVGNRLFRLRSGVRPGTTTVESVPTPSDSAKGGTTSSPVVTYRTSPWEIYGHVIYSQTDQDPRYGLVSGVPGLIAPGSSTDIFGGIAGFDYELSPNFAVGLAFGAAAADTKLKSVGDVDVDTWSIITYASYFRPDVFAGGDFYADLLYAYADHEYEISAGGAFASTDGKTHQLEFTTGLNLHSGSVVHGPYAVARWIEGDIDGHAFSGGFDTDLRSLASQLGYQVSYPVKLAGGSIVPQARAAWEHEFEDSVGTIAGTSLGDTDEDLAVLGAGVGYYATAGWNVVLDYEARIGSETESHFVGLKAGFEF